MMTVGELKKLIADTPDDKWVELEIDLPTELQQDRIRFVHGKCVGMLHFSHHEIGWEGHYITLTSHPRKIGEVG